MTQSVARDRERGNCHVHTTVGHSTRVILWGVIPDTKCVVRKMANMQIFISMLTSWCVFSFDGGYLVKQFLFFLLYRENFCQSLWKNPFKRTSIPCHWFDVTSKTLYEIKCPTYIHNVCVLHSIRVLGINVL